MFNYYFVDVWDWCTSNLQISCVWCCEQRRHVYLLYLYSLPSPPYIPYHIISISLCLLASDIPLYFFSNFLRLGIWLTQALFTTPIPLYPPLSLRLSLSIRFRHSLYFFTFSLNAKNLRNIGAYYLSTLFAFITHTHTPLLLFFTLI